MKQYREGVVAIEPEDGAEPVEGRISAGAASLGGAVERPVSALDQLVEKGTVRGLAERVNVNRHPIRANPENLSALGTGRCTDGTTRRSVQRAVRRLHDRDRISQDRRQYPVPAAGRPLEHPPTIT